MEMIYDSPIVFKRIFSLFKSLSVKDITMEFKSNIIKINTSDHLKKSELYVEIDY